MSGKTARRPIILAPAGRSGAGTSPRDLAFRPDGQTVYVANGDNTVKVIDSDPTSRTYNTIINTLVTDANPAGVTVSDDDKNVYVVNFGTDDVWGCRGGKKPRC